MLKKLLAMAAASVMMLSCFGAVAQAEYGYSWGEQIACKTFSENNNDKTTGDTVTTKNAYLRGSNVENGAAKYYLYDGTKRLNGTEDYIRLNQAYSYGTFVNMKNNMIKINTTDRAGKNFYSKSSDVRGSLEIIAKSSGFPTEKLSTTMTYNVEVKYTEGFATTMFVIGGNSSPAAAARNVNALKIDSNGKLVSGAGSFNEEIGELELNKKYSIGIVVKFIPTETVGKYTFEKTIYVDNQKLKSYVNNAKIDFRGTFYRFDIDFLPWTSETFTDSESLGSDDFWYQSSTVTSGAPKDINKKYTIVPTCIEFDNFTVYAGNKYAQDVESLADSSKKLHVASNVRNNTNYVTVAADAGTATAGKAILATYSGDKLVAVKSADLTLSADAITETDIEITNAGATSKKMFILDSLGNLKPLTADIELD